MKTNALSGQNGQNTHPAASRVAVDQEQLLEFAKMETHAKADQNEINPAEKMRAQHGPAGQPSASAQ